jgi:NAD+ diphosphatase
MQNTHPLNIFKYCPKCGSPGFAVSGDRSLKCHDCGFHFFVNSIAAVAALVTDENGKLLLTSRGVEPHFGKLDLPGGFVDPEETAEQAVERELWEELGMKSKSIVYSGSSTNEYIFSGLSIFTLDLAFRVIPETVSGLKAMDDILDFGFYAENDIDFSQIPAPSIRNFVNQFFKNE